MRRARKAPDIPLRQLRFSDLLRTPTTPDQRLANLKVPADLLLRVHELAQRLGVTKTAAMIALLNEGLRAARQRGLGKTTKTERE
jgi:hypothetical protein